MWKYKNQKVYVYLYICENIKIKVHVYLYICEIKNQESDKCKLMQIK